MTMLHNPDTTGKPIAGDAVNAANAVTAPIIATRVIDKGFLQAGEKSQQRSCLAKRGSNT